VRQTGRKAQDELEDDSYLDKSASAGRMGKPVEYLVATSCILATDGELRLNLPRR